MSTRHRPSGHLQVRSHRNGRGRSYVAYWRDPEGRKFGRTLGPAHVRDSGRRTPRGAVIWRAGDGPLPTPQHLTPQDAEDRLDAIIRELATEQRKSVTRRGTLRDATQGWVAERKVDKELKRTTLAGYELMFERLYRDLGPDTPLTAFEDGRLQDYFRDFKAYGLSAPRPPREPRLKAGISSRSRSIGGRLGHPEVFRSRSQPSRRPSSSPMPFPILGRTCVAVSTACFP
jgi:hypothetical protein